ncbi:hypothetical protein AB0B66_29550 [Catellatospora sp. NPDC049111]|uniref:hypothetical protein n=1 Tax=Catellatospora sp. NPDC049111 TaxID=3155271 RepID=UPI0033EF86ED
MEPLKFARFPSGTLDSVSLVGTAPNAEEGKAYLFDVRYAKSAPADVVEAMGGDPWTGITRGASYIQHGNFQVGHVFGLDQGRSLKLDGAKQEFRVLAQEVRPDAEFKGRNPMAILSAARDRRNYVGEAFIAGVGTTTLH